jgi:hypothetical protein
VLINPTEPILVSFMGFAGPPVNVNSVLRAILLETGMAVVLAPASLSPSFCPRSVFRTPQLLMTRFQN